ncbi:MAG: hypothetical protein ACR2J8_05975 [Thermomicrobiales bacterium]
MNADRFDRIIRNLAGPISRRRLLLLAVSVSLPIGVRAAGDVRVDCVPDCTLRDCGSDGCGGSCGNCPPNTVCIDDLGYCVLDPPDCSPAGGSCGTNPRCCDLLECVKGVCVVPVCAQDGQPCSDATLCCDGYECDSGFCQTVAPSCAPTGNSCRAVDCCEKSDTCIVSGSSYVCTPIAPAPPPCSEAGARPKGAGSRCCPRLKLQDGRCVINRGDRCNGSYGGPCIKGTRCRGGRKSPHTYPVCVPR